LKDAGSGGNPEEMRGTARVAAHGPSGISSEGAPGRSELGGTPGTSQATAASIQEVVTAALRALRSGRLDLAVDMLERLGRAIGG
jgi:hypothetical protein